jgi:hypothetical protein
MHSAFPIAWPISCIQNSQQKAWCAMGSFVPQPFHQGCPAAATPGFLLHDEMRSLPRYQQDSVQDLNLKYPETVPSHFQRWNQLQQTCFPNTALFAPDINHMNFSTDKSDNPWANIIQQDGQNESLKPAQGLSHNISAELGSKSTSTPRLSYVANPSDNVQSEGSVAEAGNIEANDLQKAEIGTQESGSDVCRVLHEESGMQTDDCCSHESTPIKGNMIDDITQKSKTKRGIRKTRRALLEMSPERFQISANCLDGSLQNGNLG